METTLTVAHAVTHARGGPLVNWGPANVPMVLLTLACKGTLMIVAPAALSVTQVHPVKAVSVSVPMEAPLGVCCPTRTTAVPAVTHVLAQQRRALAATVSVRTPRPNTARIRAASALSLSNMIATTAADVPRSVLATKYVLRAVALPIREHAGIKGSSGHTSPTRMAQTLMTTIPVSYLNIIAASLLQCRALSTSSERGQKTRIISTTLRRLLEHSTTL